MNSKALVMWTTCAMLVAAPMAAQEVMFGANGGYGPGGPDAGAILIVDQTNGAVTVVGVPTDPTDPEGLPGIDFDPTGRLFAVTGEGGALGAPTLLEVDPSDGSLIANIGLLLEGGDEIGIGDVSYQPGTGTLFGIVAYGGNVSEYGWIVTIDTSTGVVTPVGDTGLEDWGGIAFAADGTLYHVNFDADNPPELHTLDPVTGAVLTTVALTNHYMSLAVRPSDGTLFATDRQMPGDALGDLYTIDPVSGAETLIGATGNPIHDLAFEGAPQPAGPAIPTIGLVGIMTLVLLLAVAALIRLRS